MIQKIIGPIKLLFGMTRIDATETCNTCDDIVIEKQAEENENVGDIYITLSDAKKELEHRWKDKDLRKKVKEYLGEIPEPFKKEPRAVLSRSVITPNRELFHFLDLAGYTKLKPIGLEGIEDKFCTKNYDKVSLGKLSFLKHENRENNVDSGRNKLNIIDMTNSDGKRICDITTFWGENLVDFHHKMLCSYGIDIEMFDDFKWFDHKNGENDIFCYYKKIFVLFLCHGILFENFITKGNEKQFTSEIVMKSYKDVEKTFGIKPLVVPLLPLKDEDHWYFRSYFVK